MSSRIVLLVVLIGAILEAQSACINCGLGHGKDVCTHRCSQMVVRPVKLPKLDLTDLCKPRVVCQQVGGITPLKPIGDLCCCNHAIVTPAHVPKPHCHLCPPPVCGSTSVCSASSSSSSSTSSSSSSGASSSYYHHQPGMNYVPSGPSSASYSVSGASSMSSSSDSAASGSSSITIDANGHPVGQATPGFIPADPVSLALAYNMQNSINKVSEDKLSFGFRVLPKEITIIQSVKKVFPEENLYGMNGQIVELKPLTVQSDPNIEEEAAEALIQTEEEEEQEGVAQVKKLTYDEIGFGPASVKHVPYVQVQGKVDTGSVGSQTDCSKPCCDGYIPGKVIIQPIKKHEVCYQYTDDDVVGVEDPDDVNEDDDEEDVDDDDDLGPYAVPYPAYHSCSSASSSCSSSCRSSSSSCAHHNILIEKLRCS